jgi:hypothetical protein
MKYILTIIGTFIFAYFIFADSIGSGGSSQNCDDKDTSIMELEDKVQNYKTCVEDIRYKVDNAISDIKYPISKSDYNSAIDTVEAVDWCGL